MRKGHKGLVPLAVFVTLTLAAVSSCSTVLSSSKDEPKFEEPELESEPEPVYRLPEPERVLFYRDGTTVYDAKIPFDAIIDNSFILPQQIDANSFTIFQNGSRVFAYSMESKVLSIQLLEEDPDNPGKPLIKQDRALLVTVSELPLDYPLDVRFGIGRSGVTWSLVLDMAVAQDNTLECNLLASIQTNRNLEGTIKYILAKRPEIILISSTNIFIERSEAMFNLGNPLLEPNKTTFMKLEGGQSSYRMVYRWNADEDDRPSAYLYCTNPFSSSISGVRGNLNSNGLSINDYSSMRLTPGRYFELPVGSQPLIRTFKSARTQEFPQRTELPFTHWLEYTVTNELSERAELEISVPVAYGREHRTQYHFTRQPDERPGDRMIWKYTLAPGANANVEFSLDSESKNNPLYSRFNYYDGGR